MKRVKVGLRTLSLCGLCIFLLAQSASAATFKVTRIPGSFDAVEYSRGGKHPSTAQATYKVNWTITQEENGPGTTCLAVATDLGTPKLLLSFSSSELGRPKGGYADSEWSLNCFGNYDRFNNASGSNYQFKIEHGKPGVANVEVYLLNAAELVKGKDDPATFRSAIIVEEDLALNFPARCNDSHFLDPPQCNTKRVMGQFTLSVDAAPTLGKPGDPFYVNSLLAGSGNFVLNAQVGSSSGSVKSVNGSLGLRQLFFPTDDQELSFTLTAGESARYHQSQQARSIDLGIEVTKSNLAGCPVGQKGEIDLSDGRGKNQDQVGINICDIRQLYVDRSKADNHVKVTIGKPKRSGRR